MRLDRGVRILIPSQATPGRPVWVPSEIEGKWLAGIITGENAGEIVAIVPIDRLYTKPLWQLRQRDPARAGRDKPDEPVPPTVGRPKANAATVRMGILTNGDIVGP